MGVDNLARGLAAAAKNAINGTASFFNTKLISQSDTPLTAPIFINGITSQYTRITNYCVDGGAGAGSGSFGAGILQVKWSNDTKGIENTICKSRATTIGGTPVAIQAGDVIFTELWYGDAGPTTGAPSGSMAHIGWYRVAIDGTPTGDSTELPGWYGLATGSGLHSPGSRYGIEVNSKQQVHFPGPISNPFGPTGSSWGANFTLGVGASAAGGAPFKWTLTAAGLLTVPEAGAFEIDSSGSLYITDSSAARHRLITDADPGAIAAAASAATATTQASNAAASAITAGGYLASVQAAFSGVGYITKAVMAKTCLTERDYTGTSDFVPLIGGGTYGTFLGVQKSTGDGYGSFVDRIFNKIPGDRGASLASIGVVNLPALAASGGWNGQISYGQSNAGGTDSVPVLTTTTAYSGMITFGSGPKSSKAGNSQGALNTSPGTSTTIALVEDTNQSDGFTPSGETICSSSARRFLEQAAINSGVDPNSVIILASSAAHGSQRISSLNKGSPPISPGTVSWYQQLLDHVSEGKARATAAGKSYAVQAVDWIQGEADTQGGNTGTGSYATYLALLLQLQVDIDADIRAITSQSQSVHLLVSANPFRVIDNAEVVLAQMQACRQSAFIHLAGPRYHLPSAAGAVHLSNVGKIRHGADFGRARYQLIYGQRKPDAIDFTSAIANGTTLVVNCKVPQPPLVLDQIFLPAGTQDYGIKIVDDTGTLTLSNITVKQRQVFITLNRALGANPKFRYALDYLPAAPIWTNGPAGNIRDSTPDTFTYLGTTYAHPYVAPPCQLLISKLAG